MDENNKIIKFNPNRAKAIKYKLEAQISVYICRADESYTMDWVSRDETLTQKEIYLILKKILLDLSSYIPKIYYNPKENYEVEFTLLYYENKKHDIKYICLPRIEKEKLAEYLLVSTSVYELKESGIF